MLCGFASPGDHLGELGYVTSHLPQPFFKRFFPGNIYALQKFRRIMGRNRSVSYVDINCIQIESNRPRCGFYQRRRRGRRQLPQKKQFPSQAGLSLRQRARTPKLVLKPRAPSLACPGTSKQTEQRNCLFASYAKTLAVWRNQMKGSHQLELIARHSVHSHFVSGQ